MDDGRKQRTWKELGRLGRGKLAPASLPGPKIRTWGTQQARGGSRASVQGCPSTGCALLVERDADLKFLRQLGCCVANKVPVENVTGGHFPEAGQQIEGESEPGWVKPAADDVLSDRSEPWEFSELLVELLAGAGPVFLLVLYGAEDEEGDGELCQRSVMRREKAAHVFVHVASVQSDADYDSRVLLDGVGVDRGLKIDRQIVVAKDFCDGLSDFFCRAGAGGIGDEDVGVHGCLLLPGLFGCGDGEIRHRTSLRRES